MVGPPTLADVMQERCEIKLSAMADLRHDLGGERQFLAKPAGFDRAEFADGADLEMLIDGVVVVHRELHHADDAAEIGNKPCRARQLRSCESERDFRRVSRRKGLEEKAVRVFVLAQAGVDALQGLS